MNFCDFLIVDRGYRFLNETLSGRARRPLPKTE
jgi:hypothetical protein